MKNNQRGSVFIYAIVIGVIFLVIVGALFYMFTAKNDNKSNSNESAVTNVESDVESFVYESKEGGFSIELPLGWTVGQSEEELSNGELSSKQYKFTKNDINLILSGDFGGKGGSCEQNEDDKPHGIGNACPTVEYLDVEKIPVSGETSNKIGDNELWYYRSKYTYFGSQINDQEEQYGFCLETRNPVDGDPMANNPVMGFFLGPCYVVEAENTEFLYYHFEVQGLNTNSVDIYDQSIVPQIEQIIKSFKLI